MNDDTSPIDEYLYRVNKTVVDLADESGIGFKTIYEIKAGRRRPGIDTLQALETASGGAISIRRMIDWLNRQPKGQEE